MYITNSICIAAKFRCSLTCAVLPLAVDFIRLVLYIYIYTEATLVVRMVISDGFMLIQCLVDYRLFFRMYTSVTQARGKYIRLSGVYDIVSRVTLSYFMEKLHFISYIYSCIIFFFINKFETVGFYSIARFSGSTAVLTCSSVIL